MFNGGVIGLKEYWVMEMELKKMAKLFKCGIFEVAEKAEKLINNIRKLERERNRLIKRLNE
jgi:hypothetical protein